VEQIEAKLAAIADDVAPYKRHTTLHVLLGIAASLLTVLVNSIAVTYFIGTSRWCREVVDTYQLDSQLAARSAALKRKTFPWALIGILTVIGVAALGALAHPGFRPSGAADWVTPHLVAALAGVAVIGYAFFVQASNIGANYQVIAEIVAQVRNIRQQRGLDD